jgi:hypothetical protein
LYGGEKLIVHEARPFERTRYTHRWCTRNRAFEFVFFYDYVSFFRMMSIEVGLNRRVIVVRSLLPCYFYLYRANQLTVVQATGLSFCRHGDDLICDFAYVREKRYPRGNADRPRTAQ